jgi:hypothetical protein
MAQQVTHGDRVGVDAGTVDASGQVGLDGRVQVDPALGDELQHRSGDKGLGDARGANVGVRCEAFAGVDVGVPGGVLGD